MSGPSISAIVPTFNRRERCVRAVRSALEQTRPPLEVVVCDDGSTDDTRRAIEAIADSDDRVRYLCLPAHTGSPAPPRNMGLHAARGDWVAFLDDDDEWLSEKLAVQEPVLANGYSLVCGNAQRSDGEAYFPPTGSPFVFGRRTLLRDNPVIISTAVVDRRRLLDAGGFPADPRLAGIEDHGAWLALADSGATGIRLSDVLARYRASGSDRLSAHAAARQRASVRLALRRWAARPVDMSLAMATAVQCGRVVKVSARSGLRRISAADSSTSS